MVTIVSLFACSYVKAPAYLVYHSCINTKGELSTFACSDLHHDLSIHDVSRRDWSNHHLTRFSAG